MNVEEVTRAKEDWLNFSLEILVEKGPEKIKIDTLCELKGVSKGSFYHHFKNRSAFIDELMSYWYKKMTLDFIDQANTEDTPIERLEKLDSVITKSSFGAETCIRAWAFTEPIIETYLEKIDTERQRFLFDCYVDMGVRKEMAKDLAIMGYANFLGMQQIRPKPSIETVLRISSLGTKIFLER
ncbi:TetR/AcrR family transcriptional regulator [Gilvimarinus sp. SDUM040013]|uniref:TetR/AcrR family transcriptional regulator n=1 Tax=Gilvimarinus gilvus TaxID=3058038 RepID=A0ABU4S544_9GAMM|nr:TetR/AcrR family transcriptional regulator [Gilvimarinus sp. SDUM040013]MDO3385656.1 TetR/AcrR family transcriptional regulator [Gilvimarinus sp. SDUM040013]MDX6851516.1 TetR/AcrR family transcriptional regulator [Gilvimarinus sp. SDUM040013]